jgi:phage shock protein C
LNCKYHPDKEAQAGCVSCGELVCKECDVLVGGRHFCRKCLAEAADARAPVVLPATPVPPPAASAPPRKLYRSRHDRWIAGVCGGIAEHGSMDPTLVRILTIIVIVLSGFILGIIGYIVAALVIPEEPAAGN